MRTKYRLLDSTDMSTVSSATRNLKSSTSVSVLPLMFLGVVLILNVSTWLSTMISQMTPIPTSIVLVVLVVSEPKVSRFRSLAPRLMSKW